MQDDVVSTTSQVYPIRKGWREVVFLKNDVSKPEMKFITKTPFQCIQNMVHFQQLRMKQAEELSKSKNVSL